MNFATSYRQPTLTAETAAIFDGSSPLGDMSGGVAWGLTAMNAGHANIPNVGPIPSDFARPEDPWYVTYTNGTPDYTLKNMLPEDWIKLK